MIDTGPIVALLLATDRHHAACAAALKKVREPLATTWPVIVEAMFLLGDYPEGQAGLWEWLEEGLIEILEIPREDFSRIRDLMKKYSDLPMDLADGTLVHLALKHRIGQVFTTDRRDFSVYSKGAKGRFTLLPAD